MNILFAILIACVTFCDIFYLNEGDSGENDCLEENKGCTSLTKFSRLVVVDSAIIIVDNSDPVIIDGIGRFNYSIVFNTSKSEVVSLKPQTGTSIYSLESLTMENVWMDLSYCSPLSFHFILAEKSIYLTNCNFSGGATVMNNSQFATILVVSVSIVWWDHCNFEKMFTENGCEVSPISIMQFLPGTKMIDLSAGKFHYSENTRTHSLSNKNDLWLNNCSFRVLRSGYYGGCLFVNISKLINGVYKAIDFQLCKFEYSSSFLGGGLVYVEVHNLYSVNFPIPVNASYTAVDPAYPTGHRVERAYPTHPSDPVDPLEPGQQSVLWLDNFPYCYFGRGVNAHGVEGGWREWAPEPFFAIGDPIDFPITMHEWEAQVLPNDTSDDVVGDYLLIHLEVDVTLPFLEYSYNLWGLLSDNLVDTLRSNTVYKSLEDYNVTVGHSISHFYPFRIEVLVNPLWQPWLRFFGTPLLPPGADDIDPETGRVKEDCMTLTTACRTLTEMMARFKGDGCVAVLMEDGELGKHVVIVNDILVTAQEVTTARPRMPLLLTYDKTDGGTESALIVCAVNGGYASFYHIQFILKDFREETVATPCRSSSTSSSSCPCTPTGTRAATGTGMGTCTGINSNELPYAIFLVHYDLLLRECEFRPYHKSHVLGEGETIFYEFRQYLAVIMMSANGGLKMYRCAFSDIRLTAPGSSLVRMEGGDQAYPRSDGSDVTVERCTFSNIYAQGNGSCFNILTGRNQKTLYTENQFTNTTAGGFGGCVYHSCPTLADVCLSDAGMGFKFYDNIALGGLGQVLYIKLTDPSVQTPTATATTTAVQPPSLTTLSGLNVYQLNWTLSHVEGYGAEGNVILPPYNLEDVFGPQPPATFECELINVAHNAELCHLNGGLGFDVLCTVIVTAQGGGEAGKCVSVRSLQRSGGGGDLVQSLGRFRFRFKWIFVARWIWVVGGGRWLFV